MTLWELVEAINGIITLILWVACWVGVVYYAARKENQNLWRAFVCFALSKGVMGYWLVSSLPEAG